LKFQNFRIGVTYTKHGHMANKIDLGCTSLDTGVKEEEGYRKEEKWRTREG